MLAITVTIELEISERMRHVTMRLILPNFVGLSEMILIFWRTLSLCVVSGSLGSMVSRVTCHETAGVGLSSERAGARKTTRGRSSGPAGPADLG